MAKDSCRDGKWIRKSIFLCQKLDEAGVGDYFEVDQDKVTVPTLLLDTYRTHPTMKSGKILRIHYRINPTNAVTFTLRLWSTNLVVNPYELNLVMLYESPAAQVDDTDYDREVEIPFVLETPGSLWYSIDWTAAPGNTTGFIEASGEKEE
jgi:hypothetical protein